MARNEAETRFSLIDPMLIDQRGCLKVHGLNLETPKDPKPLRTIQRGKRQDRQPLNRRSGPG